MHRKAKRHAVGVFLSLATSWLLNKTTKYNQRDRFYDASEEASGEWLACWNDEMVGREGFEPSTSGLKVRCSTN